jgi:hypothetical protein
VRERVCRASSHSVLLHYCSSHFNITTQCWRCGHNGVLCCWPAPTSPSRAVQGCQPPRSFSNIPRVLLFLRAADCSCAQRSRALFMIISCLHAKIPAPSTQDQHSLRLRPACATGWLAHSKLINVHIRIRCAGVLRWSKTVAAESRDKGLHDSGVWARQSCGHFGTLVRLSAGIGLRVGRTPQRHEGRISVCSRDGSQ